MRNISLLLILLCALTTRTAWSQDASGDYERAWRAIREEWASRVAKAKPNMREKSWIPYKVAVMTSLLSNAPPGLLDAQIARLSSTNLPWTNGLWAGLVIYDCAAPEYETVLLESVTQILITRADSRRLRALLIVNCPHYIGFGPLEIVGAVDRGPSFLELLTDCWENANVDARRSIIATLGQAFKSLRTRYPPVERVDRVLDGIVYVPEADRKFVEACREFLTQHKGELTLNQNYLDQSYGKWRQGDLLLVKRKPASESP
jgi:hypothetical protein